MEEFAGPRWARRGWVRLVIMGGAVLAVDGLVQFVASLATHNAALTAVIGVAGAGLAMAVYVWIVRLLVAAAPPLTLTGRRSRGTAQRARDVSFTRWMPSVTNLARPGAYRPGTRLVLIHEDRLLIARGLSSGPQEASVPGCCRFHPLVGDGSGLVHLLGTVIAPAERVRRRHIPA